MNSMSYLNNKEAEFLLSFTNYVINELECINHDISIGIIVLCSIYIYIRGIYIFR